MMQLRMLKTYKGLNAGEKGGFPPEEARQLIASKMAEPADSSPSQASTVGPKDVAEFNAAAKRVADAEEQLKIAQKGIDELAKSLDERSKQLDDRQRQLEQTANDQTATSRTLDERLADVVKREEAVTAAEKTLAEGQKELKDLRTALDNDRAAFEKAKKDK